MYAQKNASENTEQPKYLTRRIIFIYLNQLTTPAVSLSQQVISLSSVWPSCKTEYSAYCVVESCLWNWWTSTCTTKQTGLYRSHDYLCIQGNQNWGKKKKKKNCNGLFRAVQIQTLIWSETVRTAQNGEVRLLLLYNKRMNGTELNTSYFW